MKSIFITPFVFFTALCFAQEGQLNGQLVLDVPEDYENVANKTKVYIEIDKKIDSTIVNDSLKFSFKNLKEGKANISFKPESIPGRIYIINIEKKNAEKTTKLTYSLTCKYDKTIKDKTCPTCKKDDMVIPIAYGLISEGIFTNTGEKKKKEKKKKNYRSGGCVTTNCDPNWYCERDDLEF